MNEPKEIMGVWQNLSGENTRQITELIQKHKELIRRVRTSDLSRRVAWKGFLGVLWASIRYGLPSYAITNQESDRIISKLFRPMFNIMGIHRTFPSEVATLPSSFWA